MSAIETAIRNWQRAGITLNAALRESDVRAELDKTGRAYSRDVVDLYCATGGMDEGESDSHMWTFWSMERVVAENSRYERPHILFADFLMDSHLYCFRFESEERSAVCIDYLNGEEPEVVARSVQEFFETFVTEPLKLNMFD